MATFSASQLFPPFGGPANKHNPTHKMVCTIILRGESSLACRSRADVRAGIACTDLLASSFPLNQPANALTSLSGKGGAHRSLLSFDANSNKSGPLKPALRRWAMLFFRKLWREPLGIVGDETVEDSCLGAEIS